jgi:hypothetical protein
MVIMHLRIISRVRGHVKLDACKDPGTHYQIRVAETSRRSWNLAEGHCLQSTRLENDDITTVIY